jgi:protein-S-isoprenylcysteine O-methyltransferase Ste14
MLGVAMLRPVDIIMFALYLVLAGLAVAVDLLTDRVWFIALAASAVCALLWVVARLQLGRSFSVRPEAHALVTSGLYSRFRHPIYLFGTAAFVFVLLALQGWEALPVCALLVVVQVVRARREERVLAAAFGSEYAAYRASTWF